MKTKTTLLKQTLFFIALIILAAAAQSCSEEEVCKATKANAGADQQLASYYAVLDANNPDEDATGEWTVVTGIDGSFNDATDPKSQFNGTPGNTYTLRWTITACKTTFDEVTITLTCDELSLANAGQNKTVTGNTLNLEATTPVVGQGSWEIILGANGVITDPYNPNSKFTGIAGTVYTLRWTVQSTLCANSKNHHDVQITLEHFTLPAFADITRAHVESFDAQMGSATFATVSGSTILYPAGTVLIYKTNLDRYGKMEIVSWVPGSNHKLIANIITFNADGSIYSQSNNLEIRGTFFANLDTASEGIDANTADFKNSPQSSTDVNFEPKNGARFLVK
jgi:hypothetical protein